MYACLSCDTFAAGFVSALTEGGLQVDEMNSNVDLASVGPHYVGINLADVSVSAVSL